MIPEVVFRENENEEIAENLRLLYTTREGTVPLDREYGISMDCLEKEIGVAKSEYTIEVIRKTEQYEPRVKVGEVTFMIDAKTGEIRPTIILEKGDE